MQVLLISDVHANQVALEAVLAAAPDVDAIWNLGDTVGYGPRPRACIAELVSGGLHLNLAGNHDLAVIGAIDIAMFNPVARAAIAWTAEQLTDDDRHLVRHLETSTITAGYTLAHASPREPIWEYLIDATTALENFSTMTTAVGFVGHSHVALYATLHDGAASASVHPFEAGTTLNLDHDRFFINPGSVGQPRDGDPRAAFALLDTGAGRITAHRVVYDVARTRRQMMEAGLPLPLITRLARGR